MPIPGYKGGKPDIEWWSDALRAGLAYRKKYAYEGDWSRWREYYRVNFSRGIMPAPLFFSMMRSVIPRIYFRNPSISARPAKPGPAHAALALVMQRLDNTLMDRMNMKREMKRIVQYTFQFGTSGGKRGIGSEFSPVPDDSTLSAPVGENPGRSLVNYVEYRQDIRPREPWFFATHPQYLVFPDGCVSPETARWTAHIIPRPKEELAQDPRFKKAFTKGKSKEPKGNFVINSAVKAKKQTSAATKGIEMIELYEIHDRLTRKTFTLILDFDESFLYSDDALQEDNRSMFYITRFNEDDEILWGTPDSKVLEPYQRELNETRTQIMKHRRMTLVKFLYEKGMIEESEMNKVLSENVMAGVCVKDINGVTPLQAGAIPDDLFKNEEYIRQAVREAVGFSRNQLGDYAEGSADRTATEAMIVKLASEIRIDERRDMMADLMVEAINDVNQMVFKYWRDEDLIVDIMGPIGAPVFVAFRPTAIEGAEFELKIDPDSTLPMTRDLRTKRASEVYAMMRSNPLIDPVGLTQYLLHELHGVEFDNLMRGQGLQGGGTQDKPLSLDDLQKLTGAASQRYLDIISGGQNPGAAAGGGSGGGGGTNTPSQFSSSRQPSNAPGSAVRQQ